MNKMYEYLKKHAYISYNKKSNYQFELSEERAQCIANKYDNLTDKLQQENKYLEQQCKKQQEIINKIEEKIKENIKNAKYEITTLTITDKLYYKYIDDMLNELLQILEDKEVK